MKRYGLLFTVAALFLLCLASSAEAQSLLENLTREYQSASLTWMTKAQAHALQLFGRLAVIEIGIIAIWNLFRQDGLAEFFASLTMQLLGLLFFWVLLQESTTWIPAIVNSFIAAGKDIGSVPVDPVSIINSGINLARSMLQVKASVFNAPFVVATSCLSAIGVVIAFLIIGGELLLTMVEFYVIGGAGVLLLGFAALRFTLFITQGYLNSILKVGIRLFVLYVILSGGVSLSQKFLVELFNAAAADGLPDVGVYFSILAGSFLFAFLAWRVPHLAASLIGGGPALGFSGAVGMALTGSGIASQITRGIVQAHQITNATARSAESGKALQDALKLGVGQQSGPPSPSSRPPLKSGLDTVTPPAPTPRGGVSAATPASPVLSSGRMRINLAAPRVTPRQTEK